MMRSTTMSAAIPSSVLLFLVTISVSNAQESSDEPDGVTIGLGIFFAVCFVIYGYSLMSERYDNERREAQQTMIARRQQQRENIATNQGSSIEDERNYGLTEDESNHTRYEAFVAKFHFQRVLPDKSNITASSLRRCSATKPDEEHPSAAHAHDDDDASAVGVEQVYLSWRLLSSWRRPSTKDECCICLECYAVGETICAPITTECNHVFHEGCINEWLKKNDKCPLCRVELLKD